MPDIPIGVYQTVIAGLLTFIGGYFAQRGQRWLTRHQTEASAIEHREEREARALDKIRDSVRDDNTVLRARVDRLEAENLECLRKQGLQEGEIYFLKLEINVLREALGLPTVPVPEPPFGQTPIGPLTRPAIILPAHVEPLTPHEGNEGMH